MDTGKKKFKTLEEFIKWATDKICCLLQGSPITTEDSESVSFSGDGTEANPLTATATGGGGGGTPTLDQVTTQGNQSSYRIDIVGGNGAANPVGNDKLVLNHYPDSIIPGGASQILSVKPDGNPRLQVISQDASTVINAVGALLNLQGAGISVSADDVSVNSSGTQMNITCPSGAVNMQGNSLGITAFGTDPGNLLIDTNGSIRMGRRIFVGLNPTDPDLTENDFWFSIATDNGFGGRSIIRASADSGGLIESFNRNGTAKVSLDTTDNDVPKITLTGDNELVVQRKSESGFTPNLQFTDNTGAVTNTLDGEGRMSGSPAVVSNQFMTLSQGVISKGTFALTFSGGSTPLTTVNDEAVQEDSIILLTVQSSTLSTGTGTVLVASRIAGTSFTVRGVGGSSSDVVVGYVIFNP